MAMIVTLNPTLDRETCMELCTCSMAIEWEGRPIEAPPEIFRDLAECGFRLRRAIGNFVVNRNSSRFFASRRYSMEELLPLDERRDSMWRRGAPLSLTPLITYQFASQALFYSYRIGYMFGTNHARIGKNVFPYAKIPYDIVENCELYRLISTHFDFDRLWRFRFVSKYAYNLTVERYNDIRRNHAGLVTEQVCDRYAWQSSGLTFPLVKRSFKCRIHGFQDCVMCLYTDCDVLEFAFRAQITAYLKKFGLLVINDDGDPFLSFCDRICSSPDYSRLPISPLSAFLERYAYLNQNVSYLLIDAMTLKMVTWIWLMGLRNYSLSNTLVERIVREYTDWHYSNRLVSFRLM